MWPNPTFTEEILNRILRFLSSGSPEDFYYWQWTNTVPEITCSKLTIEILKQGVKYVQS